MPVDTCSKLRLAGRLLENLTFKQLCIRTARLEFFVGSSHTASTGSSEGNDSLAGQVIAFKKGVDDSRCDIPPDRKAHKHGVVITHVIPFPDNHRTRGWIVHLNRAAGVFIRPVKISFGIGYSRCNFIEVCTDSLRQIFCHLCGHAACREVSN